MMGEGRIDLKGEILPAREALDKLGMQPLELGPKEGLALINGTQASTAIALDALFMAERVFGAALAAGALSVDALKGSVKPFDPRLSEVRGQPGQIRVAAELRGLLEGSEILESHGRCGKVQDPYSFRCQPQVMGACLDLLTNAARTLTIEAGAVTDNPIVFEDEDIAISGGNFHAQPVAFAADTIAMAMCEVGSLSERRTAVLIDPKMSGLPAFLTDDGGVNSGLMIPQVTQAALVAENRSLAFPSSVDSVPTQRGAGGPCLDGPHLRAQGGEHRPQRRRNRRGRADRRRPRRRLSRAAQDQREAAGSPRQGPRTSAAPRIRPLLGRRNGRAAGGGAGWGALGLGVQPASLLFFAQACARIWAAVLGPLLVVSVWLAIIVRNSMLARGPDDAHLLGGRIDRVVLRLGRHRVDHQIVPAVARRVDIDLDAANPAAWAARSCAAIHFSRATCWPGAAR